MNADRWRLLEQALDAPEPDEDADERDDRARPPARATRRPFAANHRALRDTLRARR